MITNDEAISRLHNVADFARNALFPENYLNDEDALACDLGASAIKTIDDMSDVFQKLIMLNPSDIDNLTTFLKTHPVSEIVATINYLKENNQND
jgi:hypothetical protein